METRRTSRRRLVWALTIAAAVVFAYTLVRASIYDPEDSGLTVAAAPYLYPQNEVVVGQSYAVLTDASTTAASSSAPIVSPPKTARRARLAIPSLGIDAAIQRVTVSGHNTIGVPTNFTDVGWYAYSPMPGQEGTAIIDGHVDNGLALAGVFKHLSDIKVGDAVDVTDQTGPVVHFEVIQVDTYPYDSTSTDALSYSKPGSYLRLITCSGSWLPLLRTYDKRIVVTARLVT